MSQQCTLLCSSGLCALVRPPIWAMCILLLWKTNYCGQSSDDTGPDPVGWQALHCVEAADCCWGCPGNEVANPGALGGSRLVQDHWWVGLGSGIGGYGAGVPGTGVYLLLEGAGSWHGWLQVLVVPQLVLAHWWVGLDSRVAGWGTQGYLELVSACWWVVGGTRPLKVLELVQTGWLLGPVLMLIN